MKKEIFFAVIIGLLLGLIVTYGVYTARRALRSGGQPPAATPTPSVTPTPLSNLIITSPSDESVVFEAAITVAGNTDANAFVVVITPTDQLITTADETGNFSVNLQLASGGNIIQIFSINEDGETTQHEVTVVYNDEEATASESAQPTR
jgi:hypothetical protein